MSWTHRFALGVAVALGLMALETGGFGLLPAASRDLTATAILLALLAFYARVTPLGAATALFATLWILYLDQSTVALGAPPLPYVPPLSFWMTNVARAAFAWGAFGLVLGLIARRLPLRSIGVAAAVALLLLPFARYDDWAMVVSTYLHPFEDRYVVLAVPWLPLIAISATAATLIALVPSSRRGLALAAAAVVALASPLGTSAVAAVQLGSAVRVEPATAAPLDEVTVRTSFSSGTRAEALWDGAPTVGGLGPFTRDGVTAFTFYPGAQDTLAAGDHDVALASGVDVRHASLDLLPSDGEIAVVLGEDAHVSVRAAANASVRVLVRDRDRTAQVLDVRTGADGAWRSDLALPPGEYRLVAQSGRAWAARDVTVPRR